MKFEQHGQLASAVLGNILVLEGTGPFNIEMLRAASQEASEVLNSLYKKPWGVLSSMHGEAAYLPDAAELLIDTIRKEKSLNRIATAIIVTNSTVKVFVEGHLSHIYQRAGETCEVFEERETALVWLNRQIKAAAVN